MPRSKAFGKGRTFVTTKKISDGKFVKCEAKPPPYMERPYSLRSCNPAVVSCVVCGTRDHCHLEATSNELFCVSCLQSADPAKSWWGPIQLGISESNMINVLDTRRPRNDEVIDILMQNGSRFKRAKQARLAKNSYVSIGNKTGLCKDELITWNYVFMSCIIFSCLLY